MGAPGKPNPVSRENGKLGGRPVATPTLVNQEFRKALAEKIQNDMQSWIDPIEDLAKGHFVEVKQADGTIRVYKKSPDSKAWQTVMDRAFGKAPQNIGLDMTDDFFNYVIKRGDTGNNTLDTPPETDGDSESSG